jgi:hypothetical protein
MRSFTLLPFFLSLLISCSSFLFICLPFSCVFGHSNSFGFPLCYFAVDSLMTCKNPDCTANSCTCSLWVAYYCHSNKAEIVADINKGSARICTLAKRCKQGKVEAGSLSVHSNFDFEPSRNSNVLPVALDTSLGQFLISSPIFSPPNLFSHFLLNFYFQMGGLILSWLHLY